jgi:hypothetical protein
VFKAFQVLNNVLGAMVSLALLLIILAAGWFGFHFYLEGKNRDAQLGQLTQDLEAKTREIDSLGKELETKRLEIGRLRTALQLLKVDHRVAQIDVYKQQGDAKTGNQTTTFSFVELDNKGEPIGKSRFFTIKGDVLFVDARVIKFADEAVEAGDPMRAASLCLFHRLFGEMQQPKDGFPIDREGEQPSAYQRSGENASAFQQELWSQFWHYATHPDEAAKKGIRAAHGEAPSQKLIPGKRYKLDLRASGGLTFSVEGNAPIPPSGTF